MKNGNDGVCHCKRGLEKEKRKGGVGDVCYSFGLGQCSKQSILKACIIFYQIYYLFLTKAMYSVFCILVVREIAC